MRPGRPLRCVAAPRMPTCSSRASSSAGRASASQAEGRGFDPRLALQRIHRACVELRRCHRPPPAEGQPPRRPTVPPRPRGRVVQGRGRSSRDREAVSQQEKVTRATGIGGSAVLGVSTLGISEVELDDAMGRLLERRAIALPCSRIARAVGPEVAGCLACPHPRCNCTYSRGQAGVSFRHVEVSWRSARSGLRESEAPAKVTAAFKDAVLRAFDCGRCRSDGRSRGDVPRIGGGDSSPAPSFAW
jgi:hypothetical protein